MRTLKLNRLVGETVRRLYQREWHGIRFAEIAKVSTSRLADAEFYNAFYRELFRRYSGYHDLDANWRRDKGELASWIAERIPPRSRVLSIGAGLGYLEHCLIRDHRSDIDLHVQDYAPESLAWLRRDLPESRIYCPAEEGDRLPGGQFDVIYLCAVDYALEDSALVSLLRNVKSQLRREGACLVISASFLDGPPFGIQRAKIQLKEWIKPLLEAAGLYHRGQFWGWLRTQSEYRRLMRDAGYSRVTDGFIRTRNQRTYYVEGRISGD